MPPLYSLSWRILMFTRAGLPDAAARSSAGRISSGPLAVFAVTPERLDHLVVARVGEFRGGEPVPAVDGALRPHHLAPGGVVAQHADDRQPETHGGVVLEAVQTERAVAVDDHDALARMRDLRGERERHAHAERAERARVHPGALARHRQDLRGGRDDVTAVADHDRVAERRQPVARPRDTCAAGRRATRSSRAPPRPSSLLPLRSCAARRASR